MKNLEKYNNKCYEGFAESSIKSAREFAPFILKLISPKSILDLGCGDGAWLKVFNELGIKDYLGVDGNYADISILKIPKEKFKRFDLTKNLDLRRKFDLAISLEVAEHLDKKFTNTFIDNLVKHSGTIIFSAAIPFQGGTNHVNEQWQNYWVKMFEEKGYIFVDPFRKRFWNNNNVSFWYPQNMLLFTKREILNKNKKLLKEHKETYRDFISIVHPKKYIIIAKNWNRIKKYLPIKILKRFIK